MDKSLPVMFGDRSVPRGEAWFLLALNFMMPLEYCQPIDVGLNGVLAQIKTCYRESVVCYVQQGKKVWF